MLTDLLVQLLKERDQREAELRKRLVSILCHSIKSFLADSGTTLWLIQWVVHVSMLVYWNMKWRVPDQEVVQRGTRKRLCKKTVKHVN